MEDWMKAQDWTAQRIRTPVDLYLQHTLWIPYSVWCVQCYSLRCITHKHIQFYLQVHISSYPPHHTISISSIWGCKGKVGMWGMATIFFSPLLPYSNPSQVTDSPPLPLAFLSGTLVAHTIQCWYLWDCRDLCYLQKIRTPQSETVIYCKD